MLLAGRQEGHPACKKTEWRGAGVVICLERGADLHMAQLMPLPLTVSCFSKIQIGLPFWYRLTRVVLEKGPLNGCVFVCQVCKHLHTYTGILKWCSTTSSICTMGTVPIQTLSVACFQITLLLPLHPFNGLFSRTTWVSRYQQG